MSKEEVTLTNNMVLKKVMIANQLRHPHIQECFQLGGYNCSISICKAFLAGPSHKNYQPQNDETFQKFLDGFIIYSRGTKEAPAIIPKTIENLLESLADQENLEALEVIIELATEALYDAMGEDEEDELL